VHGLRSCLQGQSRYAYAETMNQVKHVTLLSRVAIREGLLAFPPDIQLASVRISERFKSYQEGISAIIDNDGFIESREIFSINTVANQLKATHEVIGAAFKATVTPYALAAWNQ